MRGVFTFYKGVVPVPSTQRDDRKAEYELVGSPTGNNTNNYSMDEKASLSDTASVSSQSTGITETEKPNQRVEKLPSVSTASSSSIPQTAGLLPISHQKGEANSQRLSAEGQNVQSVQASKCK